MPEQSSPKMKQWIAQSSTQCLKSKEQKWGDRFTFDCQMAIAILMDISYTLMY